MAGNSMNRRRFLWSMGLGAAASAAPRWLWGAEGASRPPNIVFILADDMGYGDVHTYNRESKIPTPNLDRLASEGVVFTDAHTPAAVCTPTRYGIVTGRYAWRSRLKRGVLSGYSRPLINRDRVTVARLLHERGYHTAVIGKWHLGLEWARTSNKKVDFARPVKNGPNDLGFDFSYIIPASLDMPPYVYIRNGRAVEVPTEIQPASRFPAFIRKGLRAKSFRHVDCLDHLLQQAVGYINERAKTKKPFFLYFALTTPHKPVLPHPRFRGKTGLGPYGDFVFQVDWTVGQVLDAIAKAGIRDNTLVIYSSDNGSFMYRRDDPNAADHVTDPSIQAYRADHHRANYVFRGTKADIWEGGHRVPFIVRWPGHTHAGTRCETTICQTDFMATCAEIVGAKLPDNAAEDSFSLVALFEGRPLPKARPPVIHHSGGGMFAIRDGKWKLVLGNGSGGRERPRGKPFAKPYQLFDLENDIGEKHNVIDEHPDIARRLEKEFQEIFKSGRSWR